MPHIGRARPEGGNLIPKVELIYFAGCPNVNETRERLRRAFAESGLPPRWEEWDSSSPDSPAYSENYGSPTVLVDGHDVESSSKDDGANCCRIYWERTGQIRGVPSVEAITSALLRIKENIPFNGIKNSTVASMPGSDRTKSLAVLPGVGLALIPKLICPACWPADAGLLGSLGLGFINYTPYLLPLTMLFMTLAVASLAYCASSRQGYKPFILGVLATAVVIDGKFFFANDLAMYGGISTNGRFSLELMTEEENQYRFLLSLRSHRSGIEE